MKKKPFKRACWRVLSNYLGMTRTVPLNCPIKVEIRAVDSQSDLTILLWLWLQTELDSTQSYYHYKSGQLRTNQIWGFCYSYDYRPNWTPLSPATITNRVFTCSWPVLSIAWVLRQRMNADHYYAFMHPFLPNSRMRTLLRGSYRGGLSHGSRTEKTANHGSRLSKFHFPESRK